jgi:hypothetical protein
MRQILFFASKADLLPVLEAVEIAGSLQYIRMGQSPNSEYRSLAHGAMIPNLGNATADSVAGCESFLVTESTSDVKVRTINVAGGTARYCVDQLVNPDSVTVTPGGLWSPDILLHGRVATVSESRISQVLMRRFDAGFRAQFRKVKAFWVGRDAYELLEAGRRLTISAGAPRYLDLTTTA